MLSLIKYFGEIDDIKNDEILELALGLANSGVKLEKGNISIADIPSTGGPSSLSTLLCPLFLRNKNRVVVKLGVSGRPAGGIDVLSQIRGYNINPKLNEINDWIERAGYVHFIANDYFAPLDRDLFSFRKRNNAINIPALVIASLLSKKIAVSVKEVGLDIRVSSYGNFGKNWEDAKKNAKRFNEISKLAGIKSISFLSNNDIPQQGYIGRSESLLALKKIFNEEMDWLLQKHLERCFLMSLHTVEANSNNELSIESIQKVFFENINTQGGNINSFYEIAEKTNKAHNAIVNASYSGFLQINIEKIRSSIAQFQKKYITPNNLFPDPCGIILQKTSFDFINKGEAICSIRCQPEIKEIFVKEISECFKILPVINEIPRIFEKIA